MDIVNDYAPQSTNTLYIVDGILSREKYAKTKSAIAVITSQINIILMFFKREIICFTVHAPFFIECVIIIP